MIDTSRIHFLLPILGPAQVVHYAQPDDLAFIQWWITYLRSHERVPSTVRTTVIGGDAGPPMVPRLVVTVHDGHSERGEILRIGQSLVLHERRLTVLDTDTLYQRFTVLRDPLSDHRRPRRPPDHSVMDSRHGVRS